MALQPSFTYRFADIEVREPELRVIRSGEPLAIEPKAFRVLICLLRHSGHLVSKEELLTDVWGDTAVTDNSLTRVIALLRRLLEDDPHQPRYIETVSTAGYRFICPVETGSAEAAASKPSAPGTTKVEATEPRSKDQRIGKMRWIALAASGVVLAGAAGLTWYALRPLPTPRIASYSQITTDGQTKTIVGTDGSSLYLNLFAPAGFGAVPVAGGDVSHLKFDLPTNMDSPYEAPPAILAVSTDGSRLLIGSGFNPSTGRELWVVNAHGGGARHLTRGNSATWSPDGRTILYSTVHGDLYFISSQGGEPHLLLASPAPQGALLSVSGLTWSSDGKVIRFSRSQRYWEVSADGKEPHEILSSWHAANPKFFMDSGRWTPDGHFFLFVGGSGGAGENLPTRQQIWALDERRSWFHHGSSEPFQLTTGATIWGRFAFSKDAKTLYSTAMIFRGELVRYDANSKELVPYLGGISAEYVNYSKDGKYLVYVKFPDGTMWRCNRDGSGLQQLTGSPFFPITPRWSPDSKQIVFFEWSPTLRGEMYTVPSNGGTPKRSVPVDNDWDSLPDWSPDGKKIVFDQAPAGTPGFGWYEGEKSRILDLDTGKVTDLPKCPRPCYFPRWSPNGRYILKITTSHDDLLLLDLQSGRWSQFNLHGIWINYPSWSHDGHNIYFADFRWQSAAVTNRNPGIFRVPITGGTAEEVANLRGFRGTGYLEGGWSDLDPEDHPLLLREAGIQDIYAQTLEFK